MNVYHHITESSPRRGTTLIEITAVMVLFGTLLLLSLKALSAAGSMQEMSIAAATELRLTQLAEQRLRADIGSAHSATSDGDQQFTLRMGQQRSVRYRVAGPRKIDRESITVDAQGSEQISGRDTLHFMTPVGLQFESLSNSLVRVTLELPSPKPIIAALRSPEPWDQPETLAVAPGSSQ